MKRIKFTSVSDQPVLGRVQVGDVHVVENDVADKLIADGFATEEPELEPSIRQELEAMRDRIDAILAEGAPVGVADAKPAPEHRRTHHEPEPEVEHRRSHHRKPE